MSGIHMSWRALRRNLERYGTSVRLSDLLGCACRPVLGADWMAIVQVDEFAETLVLCPIDPPSDRQVFSLGELHLDEAAFVITPQLNARFLERRLELETAQSHRQLRDYGPVALPAPRPCGADLAVAASQPEKRLLVIY